MHPDKNPSSEAPTAFAALQKAFECIYNDDSAEDYNNYLMALEENIQIQRHNIKQNILNSIQSAAGSMYYYAILGADHVYTAGMELWDWLGQWEVEFLGGYHKLAQYATMGLLLFSPGRILLQIHAVAYGLLKMNKELVKDRNFE